jgi:hypothetical protein
MRPLSSRRRIAARGVPVPVGLLGLATKMSFVRSVTARSPASGSSWNAASRGTSTMRAFIMPE